MFGIGPMELVLILVVGLLVLGPKRMPELARTLGRGLGEFRRASSDLRQSLALDEIQNELRDGITGIGNIKQPVKKPDVDDKPAQAGDELDPGKTEAAEAADASNTPEDSADSKPHEGELPLDADPHEHHEPEVAETPDERAAHATSQAADDGLGAVPVGRRAAAARAEALAQEKKADATDETPDSEDERG